MGVSAAGCVQIGKDMSASRVEDILAMSRSRGGWGCSTLTLSVRGMRAWCSLISKRGVRVWLASSSSESLHDIACSGPSEDNAESAIVPHRPVSLVL